MMRRRWGDADDDEDVLPENTTVGPNDKGIITKTEYYRNAKGVAMKKVTKTQLVKVETKVYDVSIPTCVPVPFRAEPSTCESDYPVAVYSVLVTVEGIVLSVAEPRVSADHSGEKAVAQVWLGSHHRQQGCDHAISRSSDV